MTTVMMVEITGDPLMIGPVGLATLVAVIVGNRLNHGLYHSLIDVASFPFLPDRWPKHLAKSLRVEHTLPEPGRVVCVRLDQQREEVVAMLQQNDFSGFPVVDGEGVVIGLTTRVNLQKLLDEDRVDDEDRMDIGKVTDIHHVTIQASTPLELAFDLFKRMEVAHMIVVDSDTRPKAMMTRSSLLPWAWEDLSEQARPTFQRPTTMRGASPGPFRGDRRSVLSGGSGGSQSTWRDAFLPGAGATERGR